MAIDLFTIGKFTVHGYGLMIGLGFLLAVLWGCRVADKKGLSGDHVTNLAIFVLLFGFMGGKLLYIIVDFRNFIAAPMSMLGTEGFVVYGGIISGILTIIIYCRIKKINILEYLDIIGCAVPLNQALGRVGCFLAGCCYGRETNSWFSVVFPEGCLAPAGVKLIPAQLVMAAGDFVIFILLNVILFKRKKKINGQIASLYLVFYSIGRFLVEFIRNDYRGSVGVLSTSQFIAIWSALGGLLLYYASVKYSLKEDVK